MPSKPRIRRRKSKKSSNSNNNNKNNKPATKVVTRTKIVNTPITKQISAKAVSMVCGLVDPFCVHANGSKYPDVSSNRTLAFTYKSMHTFLSDASGFNSYITSLQYGYYPFTIASAYVASNVTAWTDFAAVGLISAVSQYRIVSAGFRLKRIGAPLTMSGLLSVRIYSNEVNTAMGAINTQTFNCSKSIDIPIQDCHDLVIVYPHTSQMPTNFYKVSDDTGVAINTVSKGFAPITLYLSGCPVSSAIFTVEHVVNYELIFDDSSGLAQVATPAPKANTALTSAAAVVSSTIEPIMSTGLNRFADYVVSKAKTALIGAVSARFGPIAGGGLAIMVD